MRIGYLECFSGISGDMFLGALVDAGVSFELLRKNIAALGLEAELKLSRVDRSGISASKIDVLVAGHAADSAHHDHAHSHAHDHHPPEHAPEHGDHSHQHGSGDHSHSHEHSHPSHGVGEHSHQAEDHAHAHKHSHGRSLSAIRELIQKAELPPAAKQTAIRAFELLGDAEAHIHNVPVEQIHFHEVGAVDTIVDIVGAAVGSHLLGVEQWICSPLDIGGGTVHCAHGVFPVPAPATLELLKDVPVYSSGIQSELVTPTGAAIVRALQCGFTSFPALRVQSVGYGAGTRNPTGRPNVLRLTVGEVAQLEERETSSPDSYETVNILETQLDDISPQVIGYVAERALAEGALDFFSTAVQMKKNRPGALLTVICKAENSRRLRDLLFRETSTLGIRMREERRATLARSMVAVRTPWGEVRLKVAGRNGSTTNFAPEYEDCRRIAEANALPLKQVQQEAIRVYLEQQEKAGPKIA